MISRFSNLRHIEIINTSNVTVRNLIRIQRSMPKLVHVQGSVILEPRNVISIVRLCHAIDVFKVSHKQFRTTKDQQISPRKWYHLTRMYYPWVKFAETLTCEIQGYLSTRKEQSVYVTKTCLTKNWTLNGVYQISQRMGIETYFSVTIP